VAAISLEEPDRVPVAPRVTARFLPWLYGSASWRAQVRAALDFGYDAYVVVAFPEVDDPLVELFTPRKLPPCYRHASQEVRESPAGPYVRVERIFKTPAGELREVRLVPSDRELARVRREYSSICPPNWVPEGFPYIREHLVRSEADIDKVEYLIPDPSAVDLRPLAEACRGVGDAGVVAVSLSSPFTWLAHLLGLERAMVMYYRSRGSLVRLLRALNELTLAEAELAAEAGADLVYVSGCYSSLSVGWGPRAWRELFKPLIREQASRAHELGLWYHYYDDGRCADVLLDVAECGVDVLSTLVPPPSGDVDLAEAKRLVGDRVCLKGNVDIEVLRRGTPRDAVAEVRRVLSQAAEGGGLILSTSDSVHAYTPLENFRAMVRAGVRLGRYPAREITSSRPRP